jgi:hypothetical protein
VVVARNEKTFLFKGGRERTRKKKMDEDKVLKIHDCSELPQLSNLEKDTDCLDRIAASFQFLKWRGNGQYGFAIETIAVYGSPPKKEKLIVKIGDVNVNEIRVACELNGLMEETPVFAHTYGWVVCHVIPRQWERFLLAAQPNHELLKNPPPVFLFTFVQPIDEKWDEILLNLDNSYRVTLFFLLHGLYVAKKQLGFNHGDIHAGNIMVEYFMTASNSTLRYGQYEATVTSKFVPRFIDYGRSTTTTHAKNEGASDLRQLRKTYDERLEYDLDNGLPGAQDEAIEFNRFVASTKWRELEQQQKVEADSILPLLMHSYFDISEIQRHQVKRQATEPIQRCFSCCSFDPLFQVDLETPKYFCSDWCYEKIHGIGRFIK